MSFGEEAAAIYDDAPRGDEAETVAFLAGWPATGRRFELAIGTGRIALPLAARGVRVDGIDLSPAMVERCATSPAATTSRSRSATSPTCRRRARYRLIYVVFNTLFNLLTQDDQVRCFENVATHLTDDGVFVVEAFVPTLPVACATINTSTPRRSRSTRFDSTSAATTR